MSGYLLDTNVLSEFNRKGEPDHHVRSWLVSVPPASFFVSVITLGEIRLGIQLLAAGKRRSQLEGWFEVDLQEWFAGRVLPVTEAIADVWASFTAHRQLRGRPIANFDGLLAATARHHSLTLVTRNVRDFVDLPIPLINPWEQQQTGSRS